MKKLLSVFLSMLLVLSLCVPAFAAEGSDELKVTVANDLHYNLKYSFADSVKKHNSISEDYAHISSTGKLLYETAAIIEAFLEKAKANDSDVVLLPGDLVELGTVEEHIAFAAILNEFEQTSGKHIYVIPGNHDFLKTTPAQFVALYNNFGYSEALAMDTSSYSYTVDLKDGYRLLAIDSTNPGKGPHGMTQERVNWIAEQCAKAKADGKKVIAMMHHSLLDHFTLTSNIHLGEAVNTDINLADVLAEGGVKYIFTGHIHIQDILSYTSESGVTIYDVSTGSLSSYPCPYREVTFGENVEITTKKVESIDYTNVASGISENALALAKSDFTQYTYECGAVGMRIVMTSYIKPSSLIDLMKLDTEKDAELCALVEKVGEKICEAAVMPLYTKDAAEGEQSIEALVAQFGKPIPESKYTDLIDILVTIYLACQNGDEDFPGYTKEMLITTRGFAALLAYALEDVSAEDYALVLQLLFDSLGVEVPSELLVFTGSIISIYENLEIALTSVVMPVMTNFSDDTPPADNNVTLPGYEKLVEDEPSIWEQIVEFFRKILNFFTSIFNIMA
ncbi:MAG: metallophosphoesterase [Clostridia bacterium]|nr:metallophosphoesterase [Clostridia bacterium]